MLDARAALDAGAAILVLAAIAWVVATRREDVSVVDSFWSMFFLLGAIVYTIMMPRDTLTPRSAVALGLLAAWAIRLCVHITLRNRGQGEDRRYGAIRARHEPGFAWKSLYLVFGLQALLAFVIVTPVMAAIGGDRAFGALDTAGVVVWSIGFAFEAIGDAELARFKRNPANQGKVLDTGLWRYTRHPNYFGEATQWWGYYLLALGAGAPWTIVGPLTITFMLLKVSGITLLEKDIGERRPAYRDYVARTSPFLPWPPRGSAAQ